MRPHPRLLVSLGLAAAAAIVATTTVGATAKSTLYAPTVKAATAGAAATAAAATSATAPTGFAQGVHISDAPDGNFDEARVAPYEAWLGHSVPLAEVFGVRTSESVLDCPSYILDPETAAHQSVIIEWDFFDQANATNETWAAAAHGTDPTGTPGIDYDQRYTAFAKCLVAHGQSHAIIRVAQEFNFSSGGMPPVPSDDPTTVANFISAFRTFVTDARAVPGADFTFDWNPAQDSGNPLDLTYAYPGDAYVDVVGIDVYDTATPWGSAWTTPQQEWSTRLNGYHGGKGIAFYRDFAVAHHKPISFPEWGLGWEFTNNGATQAPADDAYFVQQMYDYMAANDTLYESFWEDDDRGLYTAVDHLAPTAAATFQDTFGAHPSAPWPTTGAAVSAPTRTTPIVVSHRAPVRTPAVAARSKHVASALSASVGEVGGSGSTATWTPPAGSTSGRQLVLLTTTSTETVTSVPAGWTLLAGYPQQSQQWGTSSWLYSRAASDAPASWGLSDGGAWVLGTATISGSARLTAATTASAWDQTVAVPQTGASGLDVVFVTTLQDGSAATAVTAPDGLGVAGSLQQANPGHDQTYGLSGYLAGAGTGGSFGFADPACNPTVTVVTATA